MKKILSFSLLTFTFFISASCQAEVVVPATPTILPSSTPLAFITATLPVTQTPFPSQTPLPSETSVSAPIVVGDENQVSIMEPSSTESVALVSVEPTTVFAAALDDGDSVQYPAVNITLSEESVPILNYSSDISSPDGDSGDWVQFSLDGQRGQEKIVSVVVDCSGNGKLNLALLQNTVTLQEWENISCGQRHQLQLYLYVSAPYSLHLSSAPSNTVLNYLSYTLTVQLMK